ncbi:MAG: methenyltetrahydrofolate cyclohydrolase, partial [Gammaproteobacteria bacterium RIFCSPLOWO2_02_FULL_61_13]
MIKEKSVQDFLDELASKAPTPGGGGAAAVMGAMGAALVSMVAHFTLGKKGYEAVESESAGLLQQAEALRRQLAEMVRADVDAFNQVMGAYGMARESDVQKAERTTAIQAALKQAADVPLACAELCAEVIRLTRPMAAIGNKNVISDVGVAVLAAEAALRSAALNVYVNIGAIKDEAFVADRRQRLERIL